MEQINNYINFIKWIALDDNNNEFNWDNKKFDSSKAKQAIDIHRVHMRAYEKVSRSLPKWFDNELTDYLNNFNNKVLNQYNRYIKELKLVTQTLSNLNQTTKLIVIKGFTSYYLTGDINTLRITKDIDLLYNDLPFLKMVLFDLGYKEEKKETEVEHEYVTMIKDDISLDIHNYFPVPQYTDKIKEIVKNPVEPWFLFGWEDKISKIKYEDLKNDCIETENNLLIPDVNMSILIICGNIFKDYFYPNFNSRSHISISELIRVKKLTQADEFNPTIILKKAKKYGVINSLYFVITIFQNLFKTNPLIIKSPLEKYPKRLLWNGTFFLPNIDEKLLFCNLDNDIQQLSYNNPLKIELDKKYTELGEYNTYNTPLLEVLKISEMDNNICIKLQLSNPGKNNDDVFRLILGYKLDILYIYSNNKLKLKDASIKNCARIKKLSHSYQIEICFPISSLNSNGPLPIILCVERWHTISQYINMSIIPCQLNC